MSKKDEILKILEALPKDQTELQKTIEDDLNVQAWFAVFYHYFRPGLSLEQCLSDVEAFLEEEKTQKTRKEPEVFTALQLKTILAHIIKYTIPVFESESVETIVGLLENEEKPESLFVENLSERSERLFRPIFVHDLVFKIKLPEGSESKYAYFIIGLEPQSYKTSYPLEVRAILYSADLFLGENEWLLLERTEDSYKKSVPAYCIFLNMAPRIKEANTIDRYSLSAKRAKLIDGKMVEEPLESESLINAIIVNVGGDYENLPKGVFNFVGNLLFKQSDEKTEAFLEEYGISEKKEEKEVLMAGFERAKYEEGLEKGRSETKEEDRAILIDFCRRIGYSDEQINEELARYGYDLLKKE